MNTYWWEIQVLGDRALEEVLFWRLQQFGCQGTASQVEQTRVRVKAYLPEEKATSLDLAALALWLRQDALVAGGDPPLVSWDYIHDEDWSTAWKQHWHPQEIGDAFLVCPAWITPPPTNRHVLRLDPGNAFGTGAHITTQLCLEALEMRMLGLPPDREFAIADIGCGSGILSIGAVLLGATQVYAVDVDSTAVAAANYNRQLNQIPPERLHIGEGSIERLLAMLPSPVDGFTCNILAEIIIEMVPHLEKVIHSKGWGILSGIILERVPEVVDTLEKHGWVVGALWKRKEWSCLNIRRAEL